MPDVDHALMSLSRARLIDLGKACWLLVAGCWLLVAGCWLLVADCRLPVAGEARSYFLACQPKPIKVSVVPKLG